MGSKIWEYFSVVLVLTLVIFIFTVTQLKWVPLGHHVVSPCSRLKGGRPSPPEYSETTKYHVTISRAKGVRMGAEEPASTIPVVSSTHKLAENASDKPFNSEDMPDKWCQYMAKSSVVNPHPYKFLITGASLCSPDTPFMMIFVPSMCIHYSTRKLIRETWGSVVHTGTWPDGQKLPTIKLAFLFGSPLTQLCDKILKNESKTYGDIVVSDFTDSYRNLTLKSVSALKWVSEFCPRVPYVMKCDEDTFAHLPRLVKLIRLLNSSNILIGGLAYNKPPFGSGRWAVNENQFPFRRYPTYVQGQVYILSGKIIPKLFQLSEYFNFIPIEDVFVTGVLARCARVTHCEKRYGSYFNAQDFHMINKQDMCYFYKGSNRISVTKVRPKELSILWDTFRNNSECFRRYNKPAT